MKEILLSLITISCFFLQGYSQVTFQKTYGDPLKQDGAFSIISTNDSNYVFVGTTATNQNPTGAVYIVKINGNGDTLWTKIIGDTAYFRNALSVEQTNDSGFIIAAYNFVSTYGIYIIKADILGNIQWTKNYTDSNGAILTSIHQTFDGGYIAVGTISNPSTCLLMKLNSSGDTLWTRKYSGISSGDFRDVKETYDSCYVVVGRTSTVNNSDILLIKSDAAGNLLWSRQIDVFNDDFPYSLEIMNNTGLAIGFNNSILKTDATGNPLWCKSYYAPNLGNYLSKMIKTSDDGFALTGYFSDSAGLSSSMFLIKTDSIGDTLWTNSYSYLDQNAGKGIVQTYDGGFLVTGYTHDEIPFSSPDIYLVKTDTLGRSGCNEQQPIIVVSADSFQLVNHSLTISAGIQQSVLVGDVKFGGNITTLCFIDVGIEEMDGGESNFTLYPNPVEDIFTIEIFSLSPGKQCLSIYNVLGKEILRKNFYSQKYSVNVSVLADGIFIAEVQSGKNIVRRKFVKE
jgi:hypothetical protein